MLTHIIWFRRDLRVTDNLALSAACQDPQAKVIAVYLATPAQWQKHHMAPRQAELIFTALSFLQQQLAERGIPLIYHQLPYFADAARWLVAFCREQDANQLFFNQEYEYREQARDRWVEHNLPPSMDCHFYSDSVLLPPGLVLTGAGEMFKVFTPFRQAFIRQLGLTDYRCLAAPKSRGEPLEVSIDALQPFDYPKQSQSIFPKNEAMALDRLREFCRQNVEDYRDSRDFPAQEATSLLSACLALGLLSPRQCLNRLQLEQPNFWQLPDSGAFCWFNELVWREFYRHLLVAYPRLSKDQPFIDWTKRIVWRQDKTKLHAWQQGMTGYPLVDAAMRQLNQTGWMHNRLRMISASFLVKDLLIDWRQGENYFMSQLIDGDLAANNGGWQWAASTGTDSSPYFRIFNPVTQAKRFDSKGEFIRAWLPELEKVPAEWLYEPHRWAQKQNIALDYPLPIVEHSVARIQVLAAFAAAKDNRNHDD